MRLRTLILRNILRSPRNFAFSSAGLVLGITTFLLFLCIGAGLRENVLRRIFVVDQIEVSPPRGGLFGQQASLDDEMIETIRQIEGVTGVHPRQQLAFPSYAVGGEALIGTDLWAELIADGVPPELIREELGHDERDPLAFTDWETVTSCSDTLPCPPSHTCEAGSCSPISCTPGDEVRSFAARSAAERHLATAQRAAGSRARAEIRDAGPDVPERYRIVISRGDPDGARRALRAPPSGLTGSEIDPEETGCSQSPAWCHPGERACRMPVPAIASTQLLELYNSNVQTVLGGSAGRLRTLPRLSADGLRGFQFDVLLGRSFLGAAQEVDDGGAEPERLRMHLVGFSPRAIPIGATLPIGYVSRWNVSYRPDRPERRYDSLLVIVRYSEDLDRVARVLEEEHSLLPDPRYETSRRASLMVSILIGVMVGLSLMIVALAALNIMNTLLMLIAERQREIGVLRALGATRLQLHLLVLGEAALLALVSTALSWLIALSLMAGIDAGFTAWTADFPFKPASLFVVQPLLVPGSLGLALLFCTLGAWLPAHKAARMDPAVAFRSD